MLDLRMNEKAEVASALIFIESNIQTELVKHSPELQRYVVDFPGRKVPDELCKSEIGRAPDPLGRTVRGTVHGTLGRTVGSREAHRLLCA